MSALTGSGGRARTPLVPCVSIIALLSLFGALLAGEGAIIKARLFFPDGRGGLVEEERAIDPGEGELNLARGLVAALAEGPRRPGGVPAVADGAGVRAIFLVEGTAYLDLTQSLGKGLPGGVRTELRAIRAVVATLCANMEGVREVRILVDGREAESLSGHIDLSVPFRAGPGGAAEH